MGLFSLTMNTLVITPASYLFGPLSLTESILPYRCHSPSDSHQGNPLLRLSLDSQSYWTCDRWNCRLYDQYYFRSKWDLFLLWK